MDHLPILGPAGEPTFRFGGLDAFKQRQFKDYTVSLEWFGPNGRHVDACMVIWSTRPNSNDAGVYIVGRKQAYLYCDADMWPTPYAFAEARAALPILGRAVLDFEVHALVDTILQHIDDLMHMPVAPQRVRQALAGEAMFEVRHSDQDGRMLRESTI